ncbi:MFS transporter [Virgisporangium ochraceum]|uniref:MFS transporter n=1 Tax=Virgisporangium ochraceum TaxID=65505 RepID=A0A8J4A0V9_9ACTN|nr:MFS transporter [Virgisporangium ochraceum]GIJ71963.1 MFS transporter [Virgisporangium ochraceum]
MTGPSRGRAVAALLALTLGSFAFVTTENLPIGLLTLMADDLDRSLTSIGFLVTGFAAVVVIASVPLTHVSRNVPRRALLGGLLALFSAASVVSAVAPNYETLFGARLVTALCQGLFWSVVNVTAAAMFRREVRGRALSVLSAGGTLGPVLGVPAGTWLGQQTSWRGAFVAMTVLAAVTCLVVIALLPADSGLASDASHGASPDRRRFWLVIAATAVATTGYFTTFTYITAYLLDVSGWPEPALGPLLFASGSAGLLGVFLVSALVDRRPRLTPVLAAVIIAAALLGLAVFGGTRWAAVVFAGLGGAGLSAFAPAVANRMMQVAPGRTDLAGAVLSSGFNVGIAAGSFIGGALVATAGVRSVAFAGGLITVVALMILSIEPLLFGRSQASTYRLGRSDAHV